MNLHAPQRLEGETFDQYRARRAKSNALNKARRQGLHAERERNHKATASRRLRRSCVALVGIRQHKRQQRAAKTDALSFI